MLAGASLSAFDRFNKALSTTHSVYSLLLSFCFQSPFTPPPLPLQTVFVFVFRVTVQLSASGLPLTTPSPPPPPPTEQLHQDVQVHPADVLAAEPVRAVPAAGQLLLCMSAGSAVDRSHQLPDAHHHATATAGRAVCHRR